ncbi:DUF6299 family protein [Kitasatospora brasiliensis]|uniref:DUF6299 family protein n=1 Tax=Kitasatospora brasiliensis TaxID=3058040 RepID=UPI00292D4E81|nr:DUF6299 family protein [Kitasatospora sp. K002]
MPIGRPRPLLAGLSAAALLTTGFSAHAAATTTASTRAATTVTGGLNVGIKSNSVTVGLGRVSAVIVYTCTSTSAPNGQAALRVDFNQANNTASGEVTVPCGPGNVNMTQTVTAVQIGMSATQGVSAIASLNDGTAAATDIDYGLTGGDYVTITPSAFYPGDGTVHLSGSYNCASGTTTPATEFITAEQAGLPGHVAYGTATVAVVTCDGTDQEWEVTIDPAAGHGFDTGEPIEANARIPTVGTGSGGGGTTSTKTANDFAIIFAG